MPKQDDLFEYCWDNVKTLPPEKIAAAVAVLQRELSTEVMQELRERITYNRRDWLGGWDKDPCWSCAKGTIVHNPPCPNCNGTGFGPSPLHFTWGMSIRNLLRIQGCNEEFMGINNWDDYYSPICELAAGFEVP